MVQIYYNELLKKEFGANYIKESKLPFNNWQLDKVRIGRTDYYLFVEDETGLPILTERVDKDEFINILSELLYKFDFLFDSQRKKIITAVANSFKLYLNQNHEINNCCSDLYLEAIYKERIYLFGPDRQISNKLHKLVAMSWDLLMQNNVSYTNSILRNIAFSINKYWPVKTSHARQTTASIDIKKDFEDPRKWNQYIGKSSLDYSKVYDEIIDNNDKIINQCLPMINTDEFDELGYNVKDELEFFLNDWLMPGQINLVTHSLGICNYYFWEQKQTAEDMESITKIIYGLFYFLNATGIVCNSDLEKVMELCRYYNNQNSTI
ncbi:hypothetical protein [uncultured Lactobacillus sp.]|uniref:hypothetical protein n=1 Tax=uncultured Lactobacillus sp. TaxID=153152 RepID=UPI0028045A2A|nr:hypothetical protein [uncultured Lactobacillus sp.]